MGLYTEYRRYMYYVPNSPFQPSLQSIKTPLVLEMEKYKNEEQLMKDKRYFKVIKFIEILLNFK